MKIFKIVFNKCDYDQFDAFIVRAESKEFAENFIENKYPRDARFPEIDWNGGFEITEIPQEGKEEILLSSFNAG